MKHKITYMLITAALVVGAFFVGKNITPAQNWWEDYCESEITITDWNTDGSELSMFLSDGTEIYATKSQNIYSPEHKAYIALDEIADVEKDSHGNIEIYDTEGNVYTVFVVGEY